MQLFNNQSQSSEPSVPTGAAMGTPGTGTPSPGANGGLPAPQGANVGQNPLAQQLQSQGRGDDSMLVHMTPNEVGGLQALAMAHGGSLTINPHTGLPEAGWLGKLLPTILGVAGMAFGIPPVWMGALGAVGGTAITGDLKQGLMAGLGAFGGASMAGAAGLGGAAGHVGSSLGLSGSSAAVMHPVAAATTGAVTGAAAPAATTAATTAAGNAAKTGVGGVLQNFGNAAKAGLPGGIIGKAAPILAAQGAIGGVSNAFAPSSGGGAPSGAIDNSYTGPYSNEQRSVVATPKPEELTNPAFSGERTWFNRSVPGVMNAQGQLVQPGSNTAPGTELTVPVLNPNAKKGQPMYSFAQQQWMGNSRDQQQPGYADGGPVHMSAGSFVMPARETAEFGKGSTEAGQRVLSGLGGIPIRGAGDGTSDDIHASIGGQEARVANGEVHFPPEAVRRIGGGSEKRGTDKLYAMMKRAEQSRKKAARGGDGLNVAKGIGAL